MTTNNLYNIAKCICYLLILGAVLSCSKTTYEQLKRPYNNIEHFGIGGYHELDSINAVISGDEIKVFWSADAEHPTTIKPNISVSAGATVSPASGEEVAFSENTTYTVTAEDGTTKEYTLKPIFNEAVPVLSAFDDELSWSWATIDQLKINGEYFLTNNDASVIRAYAQRLRDGFEFDLEVDVEKTIGTQLVVDLPKFTSELDTGMHRIWVQVGDYPSNTLDIWIIQPLLAKVVTSVTLKEAGQTIYVGDTLTFTLNLNDKIDPDLFGKYYSVDDFWGFSAYFRGLEDPAYQNTVISSTQSDKTPIIVEKNVFKLPLTEARYGNTPPVGYYFRGYHPYFRARYNAIGSTRQNALLDAHRENWVDEATQRKTILAIRE